MGTHPIFESDFDCLTEMGDAEPIGEPPPVEQNTQPPTMNFLTAAYLGASNFMALYGWYLVFTFVLLAFVIKNLESKYQKMMDWWEVARAKKDPDQFVDFESARLARLERLQVEHDEHAKVRKLREEELEKERRERIEAARENGGGKATMAKWESERKGKNIENTSDQPKKPIKSLPKSNRLRGEYSPLTGAGGGSSKFVSSRKGPAKGG